MACRYCFVPKGDPGSLTIAQFSAAFDEVESAAKRNFRVTFLGGEPLLDLELLEKAVDYISRGRFRHEIKVFTNGTLLRAPVFSRLSAKGVRFVVSLDGRKTSNDRNREFRNSGQSVFDAVYKNLKAVPRGCRGDVEIRMVLRPETVGALEDNIKFFERMGFKAETTFDSLHTWKDRDIRRFAAVEQRLQKRHAAAFKNNPAAFPASFFSGVLKSSNDGWWHTCHKIILGWDGRFYPCVGAFNLSSDARAAAAFGDTKAGIDWEKRKILNEGAVRFINSRMSAGDRHITCPKQAYFQALDRKEDALLTIKQYAKLCSASRKNALTGFSEVVNSESLRSAQPKVVQFFGKEIRSFELVRECDGKRLQYPVAEKALAYFLGSVGERAQVLVSGVDLSRDGEFLAKLTRAGFRSARAAGKTFELTVLPSGRQNGPRVLARGLEKAGVIFGRRIDSAEDAADFNAEALAYPRRQWKVFLRLDPSFAAAQAALEYFGQKHMKRLCLSPDTSVNWDAGDFARLGAYMKLLAGDLLRKMDTTSFYELEGTIFRESGHIRPVRPECVFAQGIKLLPDGAIFARKSNISRGPAAQTKLGDWKTGLGAGYRDCRFDIETKKCLSCRDYSRRGQKNGQVKMLETVERLLERVSHLISQSRALEAYSGRLGSLESLVEIKERKGRG